MAVTYVGKVRDNTDVFPLLRWVLAEDKASSVKCAAADAIRQLQDPRGVEPLRQAARTYDVYVQRACGRALAELGEVEGIQLLINSLSFPSIDAFYNYDRNVPNYISTFAGFDLPDSERYVQAKWQAWFDTRRDSINIKFNADTYKTGDKFPNSGYVKVTVSPASVLVQYIRLFLPQLQTGPSSPRPSSSSPPGC